MRFSANLLIFFLLVPSQLQSEQKWEAQVPEAMQDAESWKKLEQALLQQNFVFGSVAAAKRMLVFFNDLQLKEFAYDSIVKATERGYPYSIESLFITGDLSIDDRSELADSYNFYKGVLNQRRELTAWADKYFAAIKDKSKYPRYLFYEALNLYQKKDLKAAKEKLLALLANGFAANEKDLAIKSARTLARIDYEMNDYETSLDIYRTFLLKLNPIEVSDWIEAAWNLYHLKKYSEALGYLYNLETYSSKSELSLEQFKLRALIYKQLCKTESLKKLAESFDSEFGSILQAIKLGQPLVDFAKLRRIRKPTMQPYIENVHIFESLTREFTLINTLPKSSQDLAKFLYESEIPLVQNTAKVLENQAAEDAAKTLLTISEEMKFLRYGASREILDPSKVFQSEPKPKAVSELGHAEVVPVTSKILWTQGIGTWLDERLDFQVEAESQCP